MANYIKLSNQDILDKDFEVEYKGYKVEEVDAFLDIVAEDYKNFFDLQRKKDERIAGLENEVKRLNELLSEKTDYIETKEKQIEEIAKKGLNNSEIYVRISNLERETYNK